MPAAAVLPTGLAGEGLLCCADCCTRHTVCCGETHPGSSGGWEVFHLKRQYTFVFGLIYIFSMQFVQIVARSA